MVKCFVWKKYSVFLVMDDEWWVMSDEWWGVNKRNYKWKNKKKWFKWVFEFVFVVEYGDRIVRIVSVEVLLSIKKILG